MAKTREKVFSMLLEVPKGRAVSYSELARACATSPRAIGQIMRSNKETDKYPCYKVVHSSGRIGNYSGRGGTKAKAALLRKDGIKVSGSTIEPRYIHKFR